MSNMSHFLLPVRVFMQQRIFLIYYSVKTSGVFSPDTTILSFAQYQPPFRTNDSVSAVVK